MQSATLAEPDSVILSDSAPRLESLDSAHEFSLRRLIDTWSLVEIEDQELDRYLFDDTCLRVV